MQTDKPGPVPRGFNRTKRFHVKQFGTIWGPKPNMVSDSGPSCILYDRSVFWCNCRSPAAVRLGGRALCRKTFPMYDLLESTGRKRRDIFAPELCTKKATQYQDPNFGAEFLIFAHGGSDTAMLGYGAFFGPRSSSRSSFRRRRSMVTLNVSPSSVTTMALKK